MKTKCVILLLLFGNSCVLAQSTMAQSLDSLKARYMAARSNIEAQAFTAYTNGLQVARVKAQAAGDLDGLKAVLTEIAAATNGTVAGSAVQWRNQQLQVLARQYGASLKDLQVRLTREGKIEEATAVQHERESLRFVQAEQATQVPPPAANVPEVVVASNSAPVAAKAVPKWNAKTLVGTQWTWVGAGEYQVKFHPAGVWSHSYSPQNRGSWRVEEDGSVFTTINGIPTTLHFTGNRFEGVNSVGPVTGELITNRHKMMFIPPPIEASVPPPVAVSRPALQLTNQTATVRVNPIVGRWTVADGYWEFFRDGSSTNTWGSSDWTYVDGRVLVSQTGFSNSIQIRGNSAVCQRSDGRVFIMNRITK